MLHAVLSVSDQINAISSKVFAITSARAESAEEAKSAARIALRRILARDPDLAHFEDIMAALDAQMPVETIAWVH